MRGRRRRRARERRRGIGRARRRSRGRRRRRRARRRRRRRRGRRGRRRVGPRRPRGPRRCPGRGARGSFRLRRREDDEEDDEEEREEGDCEDRLSLVRHREPEEPEGLLEETPKLRQNFLVLLHRGVAPPNDGLLPGRELRSGRRLWSRRLVGSLRRAPRGRRGGGLARRHAPERVRSLGRTLLGLKLRHREHGVHHDLRGARLRARPRRGERRGRRRQHRNVGRSESPGGRRVVARPAVIARRRGLPPPRLNYRRGHVPDRLPRLRRRALALRKRGRRPRRGLGGWGSGGGYRPPPRGLPSLRPNGASVVTFGVGRLGRPDVDRGWAAHGRTRRGHSSEPRVWQFGENFLDRFDNGRPFFADSSRVPCMAVGYVFPPN